MRYAMIAVLLLSMPGVAQQQTDTRLCQNVTMNSDGTITIKDRIEIFDVPITADSNARLSPGQLKVRGVDVHEYIRKICTGA